MFLMFCVFVNRLMARQEWLLGFIFAGIENPKYDWIRPGDAFLGIYCCGCMPSVPVISGAAVFFLYGMKWAVLAFFLGIVSAPVIVKIVWNIGIKVMLMRANKSQAG